MIREKCSLGFWNGEGKNGEHEPSREEATSTDPVSWPVLGDVTVMVVGGWLREETNEPFM